MYFEIIYQLHILEKLIAQESNPFKLNRYKGMRDALLYVLSLEEEWFNFI